MTGVQEHGVRGERDLDRATATWSEGGGRLAMTGVQERGVRGERDHDRGRGTWSEWGEGLAMTEEHGVSHCSCEFELNYIAKQSIKVTSFNGH